MATRATTWLLTGLVWLAALLPTAAATFAAALLVAGPHAGLLSPWMEAVVLATGWLIVLALPVRVAQHAWRRLTTSGRP